MANSAESIGQTAENFHRRLRMRPCIPPPSLLREKKTLNDRQKKNIFRFLWRKNAQKESGKKDYMGQTAENFHRRLRMRPCIPPPSLLREKKTPNGRQKKNIFRFLWRKNAQKESGKKDYMEFEIEEPLAIDSDVLQIATNYYSNDNKVGKYEYFSVCKGVLKNNQEITVTKFRDWDVSNSEFRHLVSLIGKFQHKNTLRLIGYSITDMLIVSEYISPNNNTLHSFLFDNEHSKMLDWGLRFKIIEGIVKGLLYLHEDAQVNIIHRDIKPESILLDARLNPKISNYEISKSFDVEQEEFQEIHIMGTFGYIDPVYLKHGYFSTKSDVYSLGVTILVILMGKRVIQRSADENFKDIYLVDIVMKHWEDGTIAQILDENIVQSFYCEKEEEISKTLNTALLCVQYDRELRPKVSDILMMLRDHLSPNLLNITGITGLHDNIKDLEHLAMEFEELKRATNNFSPENKLGEGGSGPVYKGTVVKDGNLEIAVKRLKKSKIALHHLKNEIRLVARLRHKYIVKILGYCVKDGDMLLVYEYMPNRSLDKFIFDLDCCKYLNWGIRLKIIQGIVQGLEFLHQISPQNIIHRDLKPANILLDKEMNPKISDFGISNFLQNDMTHVSTLHNYGLRGYMAPEYLMHGRFSTKSDIYSLGVMMLEIVTGKKAYGHHKSPTEPTDLPSYVLDKHVQTPTEEEEDQLSRIIDIALVCVDYDPNARPNISQVLQMLSNPPSIALPEC